MGDAINDRIMSILRQRAASGEGGVLCGGYNKPLTKKQYINLMKKKKLTDGDDGQGEVLWNQFVRRRNAKKVSKKRKVTKKRKAPKKKRVTKKKVTKKGNTKFDMMTVMELKAYIKKRIKPYSKMKHAQLVKYAKSLEKCKP
jgi:coenzyme F420-reducing hydrogenase alpha subunit